MSLLNTKGMPFPLNHNISSPWQVIHSALPCVANTYFWIPFHNLSKNSLLPFLLVGGSDGKESACSVGNLGLIPGLGRFFGEGHGYAHQYSCLGNPMDRGAWRAVVLGITKTQTGLTGATDIFTFCSFMVFCLYY